MGAIVMTGGTSGLGLIAAERMAREPGVQLIRGTRRETSDGMLPLDLERLASVHEFARNVSDRLDGRQIDALILNAGWIGSADRRTEDGLATTFVVNHLAHYLLLRMLMDRLAVGARVVLTTSGTHDPAERAELPTPRHADARLLARPEQDPRGGERAPLAAGRAYTSAKLCVVLTARALAARPEIRTRRISVVAFCPGRVPGTGLTRDGGRVLRTMWRFLATPPMRRLSGSNSIDPAGNALADLALGVVQAPEGRIYATLRRNRLSWRDPSDLARRDDVMRALWRDSAELVGLDAAEPA